MVVVLCASCQSSSKPTATESSSPKSSEPVSTSATSESTSATAARNPLLGARLTPSGLGPIAFGDPLDTASAKLGVTIPHWGCGNNPGLPSFGNPTIATNVLVVDDRFSSRIVLIEVLDPDSYAAPALDIATDEGIHIGDTADDVHQRYAGAVIRTVHEEGDAYLLLVFRSSDASRGLGFSIVGSRVRGMTAGDSDRIQVSALCE